MTKTSTKTVRAFDELGDAMRGAPVGPEQGPDPVAEEISQHLAARAEAPKPRVLAAPQSAHHQSMLEQERLQAAAAEDIAAVSDRIVSLASFFEEEVDGFFTDRVCTNLVRLGADRAEWIKSRHIPQIVDELATLRRGPRGEVDSTRFEAKVNYLHRLEREAALWTVFEKAAKSAYLAISGKEYIEQPRGKNVALKDAAAAQLDAVLARYGRT